MRFIHFTIALLMALPVATEGDGQRAGPFLLRSDPWVNLHHFLYHEARAHDLEGAVD